MNWNGFPAFFSFETMTARTFCTTRRAGVSLFPFRKANLSFAVGDAPADVASNRKLFASCLGISVDNFVSLRQVHGSDIIPVDKFHTGAWLQQSPNEGDAMICDTPGIALAVLLADCVGVLFHSPEKRVIAACHSGWKGTEANICGKVVDNLRKEWGCDPEKLHAVIGPSICGTCYEVGEEIVNKFVQRYPSSIREKAEKFFLDLPSIVKEQMIATGVKRENIEDPRLCTCENTHLWYSHRAEQKTGRFMLGIRMEQ